MIISKDLLVMGEYLRLPRSERERPHRQFPVVLSDKSGDFGSPCELSFNNVRTSPVNGSKFRLEDVTGYVKPGEILAVMGPTGCGKTSLLSAVAGRLRLESGQIQLNSEPLCKRLRRSKIGYVLQHDVFFTDLTLKQTLVYTALLRLPDRKFTEAEKLEKVEEIIDLLDLRRCQDTCIGDSMKRGLSGGEKKRLSIGCEIITNPSVLLIDEPTSGLDSYTATCLMQMLKDFALRESKSLIIAIHQPSSRIFHLFDRLLLLTDGQMAYFGQAACVVSHFEALGLHIAPNYNPADFILEQLKLEKATLLSGWNSQTASFQLQISSAKSDVSDDFSGSYNISRGSSSESVVTTWPTSIFTQIKVLSKRNFLEARPRMLSKLNWLQTLALAIMAGLVWLQTERTEATLADLEGWMFFSSTYWMLFALFGALASFPAERAVVEKERLSGSYRLSAYYISKMVGEAPLVMVLPSVYLAVAYPLMGGSVASFIGIVFVQILSSLAAQSAGLFFGAALDLSASVTAAALFTLGAQLLGGYLANNVPSYLKTLSLVYHAFRNMQLLEYTFGIPVVCSLEHSKFSSCVNATAGTAIDLEELLNRENNGFRMPYWTHTVFLLGFLIFFRALGYIALRKSL